MSEKMPIFSLLRLIRDARSTRGAQRALLNALAMRCKTDKKFISWPSYRVLALDTLLDEVTLKRAAKRLEKSGLIRRVVRANRSNCFFLNVVKLQEQATAVRESEKQDDAELGDSPFEQPVADRETAAADNEDARWDLGGAA